MVRSERSNTIHYPANESSSPPSPTARCRFDNTQAERQAVRQTYVMTSSELLERIIVDPQICFGKPTIRGHRIWVSLVLGHLAEGWTPDEIVDNFPGLIVDDVRACVAYGARLADIRFSDLEVA